MDGTLTQTNQLIYDSFNHIASVFTAKTYTAREIQAMFGPPEEEALLSIVRRDRIAEAMKEYLTYYRAHHHRLARLYPGIEEILRSVKQSGKSLALFTGKGRATAQITLEEFHIDKYFDCVVTGNDVLRYKPSSEGLRIIMERLGYRPEELLMVGDSVADVGAAHDAGVRIAAVLWDSYGREDVLRMKTDFLFHDVQEFEGWIKRQIG